MHKTIAFLMVGIFLASTAVLYTGHAQNGTPDIIPLMSPMAVNITANPSDIASGGQSILLVHVSDPSSGSDISSAHVVLNVTIGTMSSQSGDTQATGDFQTIYTGILTNVDKKVEINATVSRSGFLTSYGMGYLFISPKLNTEVDVNMTLLVEGMEAQVTVNVMDVTDNPAPVQDAAVVLSCTAGTLSPATGTTDNAGYFKTVFTAPNLGSVQQMLCEISANASKSGYIYDNKTIDIWIVNKTTPVLLTDIRADPTTIPDSGTSDITVTVKSSVTSQLVITATVSFGSSSGGTFTPVDQASAGRYTSTFNAPAVTADKNIRITVTAVAPGFSGQGGGDFSVIVTPQGFWNFTLTVSAQPARIRTGETSDIAVILQGASAQYVSGAALTFASYPSGATFDNCHENSTDPGHYDAVFHPLSGLTATTNFAVKVIVHKANFNDGADNTTIITVVPVMLPRCTILEPVNGTSVRGVCAVRGNASSSSGTILLVQVQVVPGSSSISDNGWLNATGLSQWSYRWNTSALPNGDYWIHARSFDGNVYSEDSVVLVTVDNPRPDPPKNLNANAGNGYVELSWDAIKGSTSYNVYRKGPGDSNYVNVNSTTVSSYVDRSVDNGKTYTYYVTVVMNGSESLSSNEVMATPSVDAGAQKEPLPIWIALVAIIAVMAVGALVIILRPRHEALPEYESSAGDRHPIYYEESEPGPAIYQEEETEHAIYELPKPPETAEKKAVPLKKSGEQPPPPPDD